MKESESQPEVGQIVLTKKGRDAGSFAVVIGIIDERFILIADGNKRKFDRAKKKNINHVIMYPHLSKEVKRSMEETGRVTNAKLRYALQDFYREQPEILKEGE
ncbi:hypothetical protein SAMN05192534_12062 [Alteribacillus persepolensis]|uniref:Ribosomal protein L14E/L6E/L27E n=1 Tax=Alteribacillus persepolensis TaxID=568899 RepID=A0A1G8HLK1_9BACI|nr:KOW domain-containing RNA-binding protein [Alteribacillus persepolensis]SDI07462.1 hypothetical protein SAMN05192534_12062 [Alteribacillus persepolensis]